MPNTQPARPLAAPADPRSAHELMGRIASNLERVVLGKTQAIRLAVTCLLARGHLLIEDVPGVGKTTLAESLARTCGLSFARVPFTSDLLPSDILGAQVFHAHEARFEFRRGPLFHQLVLADELNRAPPRTQSALLEAMAQCQVSLDGVTHPLPTPFTVVATQNPVDFAGTYPLPDSQLDRFLIRISLGHPPLEIEAELLRTRGFSEPLLSLPAVSTPAELLAAQKLAASVSVDPSVAEYAVRLAQATRRHPELERGVSTRAALALMAAARAHALWEQRDFVTPADVRALLGPCVSHRVLLRNAVQGSFTRDDVGYLLDEIAKKLPAPR